jgi:hypothetical protein
VELDLRGHYALRRQWKSCDLRESPGTSSASFAKRSPLFAGLRVSIYLKAACEERKAAPLMCHIKMNVASILLSINRRLAQVATSLEGEIGSRRFSQLGQSLWPVRVTTRRDGGNAALRQPSP